MRRTLALGTMIAGTAFSLAACGGHKDQSSAAGDVGAAGYGSTTTPATGTTVTPTVADTAMTPDHHSKLGGALVGAAVGHVLGGHAVAGAAAGALIQHERNKHER